VETLYQYGEDGYARIHALWLTEGSPAFFEEIGSFGGRQWRAINWKNETNPQFVLAAADGPTELDTSDDLEVVGTKTSTGYEETMKRTGGMTAKMTRTGLVLSYISRPLEDD